MLPKLAEKGNRALSEALRHGALAGISCICIGAPASASLASRWCGTPEGLPAKEIHLVDLVTACEALKRTLEP